MSLSFRNFTLTPLKALLLTALCIALAGCGNESATIRYRATAKFIVDGELREGSAVRETTFTETPNSLIGFVMNIDDRGEAAAVDVGSGHGVYFLRNDRSGSGSVLPETMRQCFGIEIGKSGSGWTREFDNIPVDGTCSLSQSEMEISKPLIVAFLRENVPASIFEATPEALKGAFNIDVRFDGFSFERVPDNTPLTKAIDQRLPWLNDIPFEGSNIRVLQ
ncbi:MAG: hypothetical protein KAH44_29815, partial [Oricola sp.]|nr:hypothetical protein [Oricola sp.]